MPKVHDIQHEVPDLILTEPVWPVLANPWMLRQGLNRAAASRETLDRFIAERVAAMHDFDLLEIVASPPDFDDLGTAWIWARCIPIVMQERAERQRYTLEEEAEDDPIWTLRAAAEEALGQLEPASLFDAILLLDIVNSQDGETCYALEAIPRNLERWMFSGTGQPAARHEAA